MHPDEPDPDAPRRRPESEVAQTITPTMTPAAVALLTDA